MNTRLPLTVLTGFLGSGKTTLVRALLRQPGFQRTAVIINEFGEIGLDHDLIASSREDLMALRTGCLCCAMHGELAETVQRLMAVGGFDRLLLETSGLADPTPILQTAIVDPYLAATVDLTTVVVTVDALHGPPVLQEHDAARRQVALADRVLLTKTDLVTDSGAQATQAVRALRPDVLLSPSIHGNVAPHLLFTPAMPSTDWLALLHALPTARHTHDATITTVSLRLDTPLHAVTLTLFLQALAENCGPDLLRVKGLVALRESPETPAVVHGVQHVFYPVTWLDGWPSEDHTTRLVLIGRRFDVEWLALLLHTIEAEVAQATSLP
ncbi:MAG: GTP-binding protein [Candidatus Tectomicrobia bacterium]|uniref:GTP-binding protein n=1 Tax=Tectimicrobiota bacterium TaxID=2528274 RepID=A0A938B1Y3_UNCTE|nr:GTP-binding protein [Candidatus Tectomicrobia bacterium]